MIVIRPHKATFERIYNLHKLYPEFKIMLTRTREIGCDFIDFLREKEGI